MRILVILCLLISLMGCSSKLEEKSLIIPQDYYYYQCETWRYEGDDQEVIIIPNGEFWGLIRQYNILGWDECIKRLQKNR